jgi:peptidyl-prolyl cis-trans isomerase C
MAKPGKAAIAVLSAALLWAPFASATTLAQNARSIPEPELRAAYDKYKRELGSTEYWTYHILATDEAAARNALKEIQAGLADFHEVAKRMSIDTGSARKGGDLGWSVPPFFIEPFADALREFRAPGIHPRAVKTDFGWHVIMVREMRPYQAPSFENVREGLEKQMLKARGG